MIDDVDKFFKSKEYLIQLLNKYKNILNSEKIEYLEALINLELSCINNSITDLERDTLSELSIYNQIIKYNIYHYTKRLLENSDIDLKTFYYIYGSKYGIRLSAQTSLTRSPRIVKIFDAVITDNMTSVDIYNSLSSDRMREKEIIILNKKIKNISNSFEKDSKRVLPFGMDYDYRFYNDDREEYLKKYQKALKKISSNRTLSKNDLEEIDISNTFYKIFINAYGIDDSSLELDTTDYIFGNSHRYMNKVKIKTMPNINLKVNNYYL